jgi:hypothetical protein
MPVVRWEHEIAFAHKQASEDKNKPVLINITTVNPTFKCISLF